MDRDDVIEMFGPPIIVIVILVVAILFGADAVGYYVETQITSANKIVVSVDGNEVYRGISAYVAVESRGATTHVTLYSRLFPLPVCGREYVSSKVEVVPQSEQ